MLYKHLQSVPDQDSINFL